MIAVVATLLGPIRVEVREAGVGFANPRLVLDVVLEEKEKEACAIGRGLCASLALGVVSLHPEPVVIRAATVVVGRVLEIGSDVELLLARREVLMNRGPDVGSNRQRLLDSLAA